MDWIVLTASAYSVGITLKTLQGADPTGLVSLASHSMGISTRDWHSGAGVVTTITTSLSSASRLAEVWLGMAMPLTTPLSLSRVLSAMPKETPDGCSLMRTSAAGPVAADGPVLHAVGMASEKWSGNSIRASWMDGEGPPLKKESSAGLTCCLAWQWQRTLAPLSWSCNPQANIWSCVGSRALASSRSFC